MSKKRRKRRNRPRRRAPCGRAPGGIKVVTSEGDTLAFAKARYRHKTLEEIRQILTQADDFGIDDELEPESDDALHFGWLETSDNARSMYASLGQRVLASLTLTRKVLEVEAMSQQRLDGCRQRLEQLLGDRIRLVATNVKSVRQALRESEPDTEPAEPFIPQPEVVAELEEKMLRQWIDESIPALGGLTPREAVKTPEGRQHVLELIDHAGRMQKHMKNAPGMFQPDYRKVKKMLGLE